MFKHLYFAFDGDKDIYYYKLLSMWNNNNKKPLSFKNSQDLNNSSDWNKKITTKKELKQRINISDAFILLLSELTIKLEYVNFEINEAIKNKIPIIIVDIRRNKEKKIYLPELITKYKNYKGIVEFRLNEIKKRLN